ncbi:CpsB/CapC family capsule biosynthesis tyrosine phosphatase [uncultured Cetobacterium sp.]|uniref:tyrosine-protein phosphatase n=1 Tax=uncultured Cetobacterium sp. TaxID=527638 RepID=UPI00261E9640|nr:CpsB/CapC family capsule biosynthesis tyrosine phosphatase [uncultured Cetobacterium sp.]
MVDVHTHLLFGVDDGPETLGESIELVKLGKKLGYKEFILTSHFAKGRFKNQNYDKNFEILNEACKKLNLDVVFHRGNEVYLDENLDVVLKEKTFNTVGGRYLLVEFSPLTPVKVGEGMLARVMRHGYIPILAHVERYRNFTGSDIVRIKKMGVKVQVNISGACSSKRVERLLKEGYIDFLGSDAHKMGKRDYNLESELLYIKSIVEKRVFRKILLTNGRDILKGKEIKEDFGDEEKVSNWSFFSTIFGGIFKGNWARGDSK